MFILDSLFVSGFRFVLDKLVQVAESEMDDTESLREELLKAQMSLELGEIDDEDFAAIESRVLARLREIKEDERSGGGPTLAGGSGYEVEVDFDEGHFHDRDGER